MGPNVGRLSATVVAGAILFCNAAFAETAAAPLETIQKSVAAHRLADEREDRTMRIVGSSGDAKERQITVLSMTTPGGRSKTLARFTAPADVKGTAILTWEGEAGQPGD